jgi:RimJ/RimL family protein N-acetyltransferase
VRFEIASSEATLSVALRPEHRSRGIGTSTLIAACKQFFSTHGAARVHAYIRPNNEASFRAFSKAGFREVGTTTVKEQPARHFVLERP